MLRKIALSTLLFATSLLSNMSYADSLFGNSDDNGQLVFGAELNPLTFIASNDSRVYFNAGVSIFNRNNSSEIAIPVDYKNIQIDGDYISESVASTKIQHVILDFLCVRNNNSNFFVNYKIFKKIILSTPIFGSALKTKFTKKQSEAYLSRVHCK